MPLAATVAFARVTRVGGAAMCTPGQLDTKQRPRQHYVSHCQLHFTQPDSGLCS